MPSKPIDASPAIAKFLRERRRELGMTLRAVQEDSAKLGSPIPHSTLARIESGQLDPGVRRLHQLLRLYRLPAQAAGDLLDLESVAGAIPAEQDPAKLRDLAIAAWSAGRVSKAMAYFFAFRDRVGKSLVPEDVRQDATLSFAIAASGLGKHGLSKHLLEDLLLQRPGPRVLVSALVQLSVCWRSLGSIEAALAFLERAAAVIGPRDHRRRGWVEHQRGLVRIDLGDYDQAEAELGRALTSYKRAKAHMDQALVLISFARLGYERGHGTEAVAAGRRALTFAERHGFSRLSLFARLETARGLQLQQELDESRALLRSILADSLTTDDSVMRFYAHYYLWRTELADGEVSRADVELREASYFVRFVDQTTPEVSEIREHLRRQSKTTGH